MKRLHPHRMIRADFRSHAANAAADGSSGIRRHHRRVLPPFLRSRTPCHAGGVSMCLARDAERAGFVPASAASRSGCAERAARPRLVTAACRAIEIRLRRHPSLGDFAQAAGMTPFSFPTRVFSRSPAVQHRNSSELRTASARAQRVAQGGARDRCRHDAGYTPRALLRKIRRILVMRPRIFALAGATSRNPFCSWRLFAWSKSWSRKASAASGAILLAMMPMR